MNKREPLRKPHSIPCLPSVSGAWWYEEESGIEIHSYHVVAGQVVMKIQWTRLLRAAQRCYRKEVIVRG